MSIKIGIGFSQAKNVSIAAESAAQQSRKQLGEDRVDMAFLLSTMDYPATDVLPVIQNTLNNAPVIGGTTAGIILSDGLKRHGVAVLTMTSNTVKFQDLHASHLDTKNLESAGQAFITDTKPLSDKENRKALFFFFDGLLENMSDFIRGVNHELGTYFPVIGAGTSDQLFFAKTAQYHNDTISSASACGVIISGEASVHLSRRHGWKPIGKPRLVTKTQKNIIEKIGSHSAFQLYDEFFKDSPGSLNNNVFGKFNARYPLGIFTKAKQEYLIRNVMDIMEDGSLACQDKVREGSEIHIMLGNKTSCLQSAADAAVDIKKILRAKKPRCLLIFESAMRWQLLKYSWPEELQIIKNTLGHDIPIFGMLTYGEIFKPGTLASAGENFTLSGNIILATIV